MNQPALNEDELLKLMDEDVQILTLVQGTLEDGSPHYAYVSIPPSRYQAFKTAEAAGSYNLALFGKILAHGKGKEPPADVQKRMVEEYGANHHFEEDLDRMMQDLWKPE